MIYDVTQLLVVLIEKLVLKKTVLRVLFFP